MPRYFFDIDDGVRLRDDVGVDLPDGRAAEGEALKALIDIARERRIDDHHTPLTVTVRDAGAWVVFRATMMIQVDRVGGARGHLIGRTCPRH